MSFFDKIKKHKNKLLAAAALAAGVGGSGLIYKHSQNKADLNHLKLHKAMSRVGDATALGSSLLSNVAAHYGYAKHSGKKMRMPTGKEAKHLFGHIYHSSGGHLIPAHHILGKAAEIGINLYHGDKWNSNKHARAKLDAYLHLGNLRNIASHISSIRNSYNMGKAQAEYEKAQAANQQ